MKNKQLALAVFITSVFFGIFILQLPVEHVLVQQDNTHSGTSTTEDKATSTIEIPKGIVTTAQKKDSNKTAALDIDCDVIAMKKYLESFLSQSEWESILTEYENRKYNELRDVSLNVLVNGESPTLCALELTLSSREYSFAEFSKLKQSSNAVVLEILALLNPTQDYSAGNFSFSPNQEMTVDFSLADGPNSSSYGTYQFDETKNIVRLFSVQAGTKRTKSVYEAENEANTCPCQENLSIRMSEAIPVDYLRR